MTQDNMNTITPIERHWKNILEEKENAKNLDMAEVADMKMKELANH